MTTSVVEVIQADRDAALLLLDHNDPPWWVIKTLRGDHNPLVQSHARHRLASAKALREALTYAEGEATYFAIVLLGLRDKLAIFVDEIEDEGDRVYLGSTNHADDLREAEESLRYLDYERAEMASRRRDLFSELSVRNIALQEIDGNAPADEPRDGPTVGFQPSHDPEQDDGNETVRGAFDEGVARGMWMAANIARAALTSGYTQ